MSTGTNSLIFPLFLIISLTIEEEIIANLLFAKRKIVSICLLMMVFDSAICFSYSKSKEDLSPLNIN